MDSDSWFFTTLAWSSRSIFSPASAVVPAIFTPEICYPNEVNDGSTIPQLITHIPEVWTLISDHDRSSMTEHRLHVVHHETGDMLDTVENEVPVRTGQTPTVYVPVIRYANRSPSPKPKSTAAFFPENSSKVGVPISCTMTGKMVLRMTTVCRVFLLLRPLPICSQIRRTSRVEISVDLADRTNANEGHF